MILTGNKIEEDVLGGQIKIDPFSSTNITTNSYDLTLGNKVIRYTAKVLDPKKENDYEVLDIPQEGLLMQAGDFLLGYTEEKVGSDYYVPLIHAKSGTARLGLFVHITADLIDIGSYGQITLQLHSTLPVIIYPGMKLAQVTFWVPKGDIKLYSGKYQNSQGPQVSKINKDFK